MKSIFFTWHLIISMLTLKGGDGDGAGSDDSSQDGFDNDDASDYSTESDYDSTTGDVAGTGDGSGYDSDNSWGSDGGYGGEAVNTTTNDGISVTSNADGSYSIQDDNTNTSYETTTDGDYSSTTSNADGSYDVEISTTDIFGITTVENYHSTADSLSSTTTHFADTSLEYTTDQHYYDDTFTEFGLLGEMYADISEVLDIGINQDVAKGLDVVGIIVSGYVNYTMIVSGTYMINAGKYLGSTGITVAGYTTLASGFIGITENMAELNTLFGGYTNSISMMDSIGGGDNQGQIDKAFAKASKEYEAEQKEKKIYTSSVLDGTVYDKMAGGITYNDVMSGGNLWGATKVANTSFSVGEPLKLGINVVRSNYPYSKYAGSYSKNLAGDNTFSVLKFKG